MSSLHDDTISRVTSETIEEVDYCRVRDAEKKDMDAEPSMIFQDRSFMRKYTPKDLDKMSSFGEDGGNQQSEQEDIRLLQIILCASQSQKILKVFDGTSQPGIRTAVCAFNRLSYLFVSAGARIKCRRDFRFRRILDIIIEGLQSNPDTPTVENVQKLHEVVGILNSAVGLSCNDSVLFTQISRLVISRAKDLTPEQMVLLLSGFSRAEIRDDNLFTVILQQALEKIDAFKMPDLCKMLHSSGRMKITDKLLFERAAERLQANMECLKMEDLTHLGLAYVSAQMHNDEIYNHIGNRALVLMEIGGNLNRKYIAKILNILTEAKMDRPDVFDGVAESLLKEIHNVTPLQCILVIQAFARQEHRHAEMFGEFQDLIIRCLVQFSKSDLEEIVHNYRALEHDSSMIQSAMQEMEAAEMEDFPADNNNGTIWLLILVVILSYIIKNLLSEVNLET